MVREKDAVEDWFQPFVVRGEHSDFDLRLVKIAIQVKNDKIYNLPIKIVDDQIHYGGIFGSNEDCLLIYNEDHPSDYVQLAIVLKRQGRATLVKFYGVGHSRLGAKAAQKEYWSNSAKQSTTFGGVVGGSLRSAFINYDKSELDSERFFYNELKSLVDEAFQ